MPATARMSVIFIASRKYARTALKGRGKPEVGRGGKRERTQRNAHVLHRHGERARVKIAGRVHRRDLHRRLADAETVTVFVVARDGDDLDVVGGFEGHGVVHTLVCVDPQLDMLATGPGRLAVFDRYRVRA